MKLVKLSDGNTYKLLHEDCTSMSLRLGLAIFLYNKIKCSRSFVDLDGKFRVTKKIYVVAISED